MAFAGLAQGTDVGAAGVPERPLMFVTALAGAAARANDIPADEIVEVGPAAAQLSGRLRGRADAVSPR